MEATLIANTPTAVNLPDLNDPVAALERFPTPPRAASPARSGSPKIQEVRVRRKGYKGKGKAKENEMITERTPLATARSTKAGLDDAAGSNEQSVFNKFVDVEVTDPVVKKYDDEQALLFENELDLTPVGKLNPDLLCPEDNVLVAEPYLEGDSSVDSFFLGEHKFTKEQCKAAQPLVERAEYTAEDADTVDRLRAAAEAQPGMDGESMRSALTMEVRRARRLVKAVEGILDRCVAGLGWFLFLAQCAMCGNPTKGPTVERARAFLGLVQAAGFAAGLADVRYLLHSGACRKRQALARQDISVVGKILSYLVLSAERERKYLVGVWTVGKVALNTLDPPGFGCTIEPVMSEITGQAPVVSTHHWALVPLATQKSSMNRKIQSSFAMLGQCAALAALAKATNVDASKLGHSAVEVYNALAKSNNLLPIDKLDSMLLEIQRPPVAEMSAGQQLAMMREACRRGQWQFLRWLAPELAADDKGASKLVARLRKVKGDSLIARFEERWSGFFTSGTETNFYFSHGSPIWTTFWLDGRSGFSPRQIVLRGVPESVTEGRVSLAPGTGLIGVNVVALNGGFEGQVFSARKGQGYVKEGHVAELAAQLYAWKSANPSSKIDFGTFEDEIVASIEARKNVTDETDFILNVGASNELSRLGITKMAAAIGLSTCTTGKLWPVTIPGLVSCQESENGTYDMTPSEPIQIAREIVKMRHAEIIWINQPVLVFLRDPRATDEVLIAYKSPEWLARAVGLDWDVKTNTPAFNRQPGDDKRKWAGMICRRREAGKYEGPRGEVVARVLEEVELRARAKSGCGTPAFKGGPNKYAVMGHTARLIAR